MAYSFIHTNALKPSLLFVLCAYILSTSSCERAKKINISGRLNYVGSSDIYISKQPVHYKYSPKIRFPLSFSSQGKFKQAIPVDSTQILNLHIDEKSYPIVAKPGSSLELNINRQTFPAGVHIQGYPERWDSLYSNFYKKEQKIFDRINAQLADFQKGDSTNVISLYKKRYLLADKYFKNTPLVDLYYKAVGEYIVKRLEDLKYRRQENINPDKMRQNIIQKAQKLHFFSLESLYAQRAGIRDFTNAFANTFGVADSLDKKYGQDLMEYDVKRLGYGTLDSARTSVLNYISDRQAKAYAKMYLVAERIGEMPLKVSNPSYKKYLRRYSDFPEYTAFLRTLHEQIERVSPGHKAIPFSLPNQDEELVHMQDFKGKYVLLDFWASWCIPCLDEFPYMKKIYRKYPRNKFEILGISIEKDSLQWRRALRKYHNPWPQLYGGHEFQQKTFRAYRGGGIPFYILIGPNGKIIRYNDVRPSFNLPHILDSLITKSQQPTSNN